MKLAEKNSLKMRNDLDLSDLRLFFFHELYVLYVLPYGLFELTTPFRVMPQIKGWWPNRPGRPSPEPDVCPTLPALVVKSMESHLCV